MIKYIIISSIAYLLCAPLFVYALDGHTTLLVIALCVSPLIAMIFPWFLNRELVLKQNGKNLLCKNLIFLLVNALAITLTACIVIFSYELMTFDLIHILIFVYYGIQASFYILPLSCVVALIACKFYKKKLAVKQIDGDAVEESGEEKKKTETQETVFGAESENTQNRSSHSLPLGSYRSRKYVIISIISGLAYLLCVPIFLYVLKGHPAVFWYAVSTPPLIALIFPWFLNRELVLKQKEKNLLYKNGIFLIINALAIALTACIILIVGGYVDFDFISVLLSMFVGLQISISLLPISCVVALIACKFYQKRLSVK